MNSTPTVGRLISTPADTVRTLVTHASTNAAQSATYSVSLQHELHVIAARWDRLETWPSDSRQEAMATVARLAEYAEQHSLSSLRDVQGQHAAVWLTAEARVSNVAHFHDAATQDTLHRLRNTLLCAHATLQLLARHPMPTLSQIAKGLPAIADVPRLKPRTRPTPTKIRKGKNKGQIVDTYARRPYHDDEVALSRITVERLLLQGESLAPLSYVLVESGMAAAESTLVEEAHLLGDVMLPTGVKALGSDGREPRDLPFDAWEQRVAGGAQRRRAGSNTTRSIAFNGRQPGSYGATASADGVQKNIRVRAQIDDDDTTATGLSLWKPNAAARREHYHAAADITGWSKATTITRLGL